MNQIIYTSNNHNDNSNTNFESKKKYFIVFSIFIILCAICLVIYVFNHFSKNDHFSNKLVNNYNISQLYTNVSPNLINSSSSFSVLGIIEIPKLNITYPILSDCTEDNLKIAPCKFSGPDINEVGNFCIAGHNYDNSLFFSKVNSLSQNDEILIFDLDGNCLKYNVYSIFEVSANDLSVLESSDTTEITLITCNNLNSNRVIVKAILDNSNDNNNI